MPENTGHPEGDTEQAKFSGAKINFKTVDEEPKVQPTDMAEFEAEFEDESEREFEDPTAAQLLAERHPTWPPIQLRIHFSAHGTSEDFRGVSKSLQDPNPATSPDIYLFEASPGNLENIGRWQDIADYTDGSASEILRANPHIGGSADEAILKGLLGSEIAVGSIDLRGAYVGEEALDSAIRQSFGFDIYKDFDQSLKAMDQASKTRAELQSRREAIMTQRLEPEIARLIAQRPELGTKDKLNIFLTLGSNHTTLFHDFKQAGFAIDRTFPDKPYIYPSASQLQRTYMFGAEARLNAKRKNELLARAYLEREFIGGRSKSESYDDGVLVRRYVAEQFGYDEIKVMHGESVQSHKPRAEILAEHWETKGLADLPQNPTEVHELAVLLRAKLRRQAGLKKEESSSDDTKMGLE